MTSIPSISRSFTTTGTPNVIQAEGSPAMSYSFGATNGSGNNNQGGSRWFSGLRAKISQLSGMSEWLSQLGIGSPSTPPGGKKNARMVQSASTASCSNTTSSSYGPGEGYDTDTGFSFQSIDLEQCTTADMNPLGWMDLDNCQSWNDTLDRQHFGPLKDLLTIGGQKKGQGHDFGNVSLLHPTWCDKCGDFIWGFMQQASKCSLCNYTCHERCRELVTLDCKSASSSLSSGEFPLYPPLTGEGTLGTIPKETRMAMRAVSSDSAPLPSIPSSPVEPVKETISHVNKLFDSMTVPRSFAPSIPTVKSIKEPSAPPQEIKEVYVKEDTPFEWTPAYRDSVLEQKINEYNQTADGLSMKMCEDGETFTGLLQIHMNFTRPINIVAGERPPTVYDVINTGTSTTGLRTITSFFLPRHTVKTVSINSDMTTRQMIVTLLRKFKVADNPRKFALYECTNEAVENNTILRTMVRVSDETCPLKLALSWGTAKGKSFVLQENDTGDIMWDAFEVPELENFLRILGLEEDQYKWQIQQKYNNYRDHLNAELRAREEYLPPSEFAPPPPNRDYGSTNSMVVEDDDIFHTVKAGDFVKEQPIYVNITSLGQSTRL